MYALVLEGGGAKGAYEIGVIKAIRELGIEFEAVAGTSIGALNGAMIVQGDFEKVYDLWTNISPTQLFDMDEDELSRLENFDVSKEQVTYYIRKIKEIVKNGGIDTTLIRKLLRAYIDEEKVRKSDMDFGIVTVSLSDKKPMELFIEDVPEGKLVDYLMASANLPIFKQEKLDEKKFLDGGFYDNLPMNMLVKKGYKHLIVIRCFGMGRYRKIKDEGLNIIYIEPYEGLGNILDFRQVTARRSLNLGYYDALKVFKGLKGRKYYIEAMKDEPFIMRWLLELGEDKIREIGFVLGFEVTEAYERHLFEEIIPKLAELLGCDKNSSYEDIIINLCESAAEQSSIERFNVYKLEEFIKYVSESYRISTNKEQEDIPQIFKHSQLLSKVFKESLIKRVLEVIFSGNNKLETSEPKS